MTEVQTSVGRRIPAITAIALYARYWIETAFPLAQAAATMAGEQSTGTFLRVPGETDELRERYAARVESIDEGANRKRCSGQPAGLGRWPKNWGRRSGAPRR